MNLPSFLLSLSSRLPKHNARAMFGLGVLLIGLLITVGLAIQAQDARSRAAENTISCTSFASDEQNKTIPLINDPRQLREELRQQAEQRRALLEQQQEELKQQLEALKEQRRTDREQAKKLRDELRGTLEKRKEELKEQLRLNPEEVLKRIQNENMMAQIPFPTENCLEQYVTKTGELQVIHADYDDTGVSEDVLTLKTDEDEIVYLHVADEIRTNAVDANRVTVTGYVLDQDMVVDGRNASNFTPSTNVSADDFEVDEFPTPFGTKKVAVILTNWNVNRDSVVSHMQNKVNNYYKQSSMNKMALAVSVYGPYSVNTSCSNRAWNETVKAAMVQAGISESQFDNIQVIGEFTGCGWGGIAFMPGKLSAVKTNRALAMTPAHEMGHNYRADHSRFNGQEYGDYYSVMGSSNYSGIFNAAHMEHIGWFGNGNIKTITSSGIYNLEPLETATSGLKALKIPRGNQSPLFIEYRQPIGNDANLSSVNGTNVFGGALLHTVTPKHSWLGTELVDVTPPNNVASPALLVGQSYKDSVSGATIRTTNRTSSALTIQVIFPGSSLPTPTSSNRPTTATPTPTPRPTSGQTITSSGYLSDKQPTSATIGWGTLRMDRSVEGNTLRLGGKTYSKGIGTHAISTLRYRLNSCTRLTADVGLDDEVTSSTGRISFDVLADGITLFSSGTMTATTATKHLDVNLSGRQSLVLQVNDGGNGINYDHADWANAYITCGRTQAPTPTPLPRQATPTPTKPPVTTNLPDLAVTSFELTDSNGNVKTTFKVDEPIFVKVVFANIGNTYASTSNHHTYSVYHRNQPSAITQYAQPSDPRNFWMDNGEYPAQWSKEYGSYSSHPNSFVYRGVRSWTMSSPGTYTARVFFDYDNQVYEANEANNQRIKTYTVVDGSSNTNTNNTTYTNTNTTTNTKNQTNTNTQNKTNTYTSNKTNSNTYTYTNTNPSSGTINQTNKQTSNTTSNTTKTQTITQTNTQTNTSTQRGSSSDESDTSLVKSADEIIKSVWQSFINLF